MATSVDPQDLLRIMEGDLAPLGRVLTTPHDQLLSVVAAMPALIVEPGAVLRVVDALGRGEITAEQAQSWASFVRHGYAFQPSSGPIRPLPIDYQAAHEDDIVEVIGRLDELGDRVDGEIGSAEMDNLRDRLRDH
jgi:hypothetical protein